MKNLALRLVFAAALAVAATGISRPVPGARGASDASEEWFIAQRAFPAREIPGAVLERAVARVAVSAGATQLLVAFGDDDAEKTRLMRSTDIGETWTESTTPKPSSFAWPALVAVGPTSDTIYLGNLGLSRSTDAGGSWSDMGALHADQTVATFDAANRLILGNDGGIFRAGNPSGSDTLYLTAEHLYRTDDRGMNWTA